jgi:hypothetical protein
MATDTALLIAIPTDTTAMLAHPATGTATKELSRFHQKGQAPLAEPVLFAFQTRSRTSSITVAQAAE